MVIAATAGIAMTMGGCRGGAPTDSLSYREHWELLMLSELDAIVQVRFSTTNTDVLRGQGSVSLQVWTAEPVSYTHLTLPTIYSV